MAKRTLLIITIVITILFIAGIYHIFSIRFTLGDVYPHYSSLRSDPMGTKIFYEGLLNLPGHVVKRDYSSVPTWEGGNDTTLFILGLKTGMDHSVLINPGRENYKTFSSILASGKRVVISLHPVAFSFGPVSIRNRSDKEGAKDKPESDKQDKGKDKDREEGPDYSLLKEWGFNIHSKDGSKVTMDDLAKNQRNADLPTSIKFPSYYYFTDLDSKWTALYTLKGRPVIISRQYGRGTIILCADSYIFSNEAMMYDRYPELLSWFVGPAKNIYFDESHFGIQHDIGIIDLAYKYRLQGVILTLILIALLFIWKDATHFVPPQGDDDRNNTGLKAERDHLDGLVSLLKRNVTSEDLIKTCITEWETTSVKGKAYLGSNTPSVKELEDIAAVNTKPSLKYNAICKKLMERKNI
jgi:hypothetical protein